MPSGCRIDAGRMPDADRVATGSLPCPHRAVAGRVPYIAARELAPRWREESTHRSLKRHRRGRL